MSDSAIEHSPSLLASTDGAVRVLALNRPDRRNPIDMGTAQALETALRSASDDPCIGAIVLTGIGEVFSSGADLREIRAIAEGQDEEEALRALRVYHRLLLELWNLPLPVVAAVSGLAYGGAFSLVLACDLVVATASARLCPVFLRRGIVPDVGAAWLLPRLVGLQRAKQMLLRAEEIDAEAAAGLGIVTVVTPGPAETLAAAITLAQRLAAGPRLATALTKRLTNQAAGLDLAQALELEALAQAQTLGSRDVRRMLEELMARTG